VLVLVLERLERLAARVQLLTLSCSKTYKYTY
jgi:hypothetical protein